LLELGERSPLSLERRERLFQTCLQGAGDEPVLRLACVELALAALGLEGGALDREVPAVEPLGVAGFDSPIASAHARTPAGVTASRNAAATARSSLAPPSDWHIPPVAWKSRPRAHVKRGTLPPVPA
jgi:hypothetical protein